jgi:hypothetical protein
MDDRNHYAGRGIWFDGIHGDAMLFDGRRLLGDRELGAFSRLAACVFPEINRLGYFGNVCVSARSSAINDS